MPITSRSIPSWRTLTPKAIDRATPVTSSSAPIAAAPCGASQPFRAYPNTSHSTAIRHDLIAADFRRHRHRACCASCRQSASYADRLPQYRLPSWPTIELDLLFAFSTQSARSSSPTALRINCAAVVRAVSPARRGNFPHSAKTTRGFVQSGFYEVVPTITSTAPVCQRPHRTLKIPKRFNR
jgi:hypothetical protein